MHVPINLNSPNNISKWQMGFNLAFKGLREAGEFYSHKYQLPEHLMITIPNTIL
jgi:hypothetical protein